MLKFRAPGHRRDSQQATKKSDPYKTLDKVVKGACFKVLKLDREAHQWNENSRSHRNATGQKQCPKFFDESRIHRCDYFKVATKTCSRVKASVVNDSGASRRNCSMICGPSPLATSSISRPLRRICSAPLKSAAGAC